MYLVVECLPKTYRDLGKVPGDKKDSGGEGQRKEGGKGKVEVHIAVALYLTYC